MRIKLNKTNYIDVSLDSGKRDSPSKGVSLSIKADRSENSYILVNTYLDKKKVDELISELVILKSKM
jgi:hypothetical protein|tara:strand:- start:10592 stop:10792 length:201 start_codon:yes stop_codon:yes gene_type:complete